MVGERRGARVSQAGLCRANFQEADRIEPRKQFADRIALAHAGSRQGP